MTTAHLICAKSGVLAASGTGKTEGHAILAATTEYGNAIGTRQSWSEIYTTNGEKREARLFEVYFADGNFDAGDEEKISATGERWGLVRLQDYVEPSVSDDDEDEEDDLDEAA